MDNDISFEIQTLYNPSDQPFDIVYNNKLFRTIPPRQSIRLPKKPFGMLAEKHLIDRMVQLEGKQVNDQPARDLWRARIVLEEDSDISAQVINKDDVLQRKLDQLNNTNDSEAVKTCDICNTKTFNLPEHKLLNHVEEANTASVQIEEPVSTHTSNILANATSQAKSEAYVLPEQQVDEVEETPAAPAQTQTTQPTREQLIAHARDVLRMNVEDPKTKELLDTLPIEDLTRELSYGI